jgi:hypothetical protein
MEESTAQINPIFFFCKTNTEIPGIHRAMNFCRKAHVVYFTYDLVPVILYLSPYLTFHNYK